MSPAAGGAAPAQPAVSAAVAPAVIEAQESGRAAQPPSQENPRDPATPTEGGDPGNAAARKTAWNVPPPPPAAVATGGIIGGAESWPALLESAHAWPKSSSSDSLKSLSDGSAPSAPEDLIVPLLPSHPLSNPISAGPNPTSTSPPSNATTTASSQQNGSTNRPNTVRHGGGSRGNDGGGNGSSGGRSTDNSSSDGNNGSSGDGNRNDRVVGGGKGNNSGNGDNNGRNGGGGGGTENNRRTNINWTGNSRGGGSSNSGTGSGEGSNRNGGGGGNPWNNNARNGHGSSNGFGGRGSRIRRDHERGGSFSPRNYTRLPHQQQQGIYQPGPFHRPPPPPPPAHLMMPPTFMPYSPPFAYPADAQAYPFYITPVDQQFQSMHLVQQPMQPLWVHQDQPSLQDYIRQQIEFYFSTNNLCHDTYLRRHMDEQGWVPIDLLAGFPMLRRFTTLGVDTNCILDAIRGSEILDVQGNNVRRRNDWAEWLLH